MTKTNLHKAIETSFGRSFLRSLALTGAIALISPLAARAESPAGKAGNEMERKGNAEEKKADAEKAKGARMEEQGKAMEEAGTHMAEITEFVPLAAVDPVYFDKAYYLAPDKGGAKPYALLAESMRKSKQTAVGRYAARGKQYIVQLRPVPGGLVMQQLLYAPEVRTIEDVEIPEAPVRDAELTLAQQLIAQISSPTFDPTKYEDDVKKRIEADIERKMQGQDIAVSGPEPEPAPIIDLMEALKASLGKSKGGAAPAARASDGDESERKPARRSEDKVEPKKKAAKR